MERRMKSKHTHKRRLLCAAVSLNKYARSRYDIGDRCSRPFGRRACRLRTGGDHAGTNENTTLVLDRRGLIINTNETTLDAGSNY